MTPTNKPTRTVMREKGRRTMKFKTTQKATKQGYKNVIKVPYCGLQSLLSCESPTAYTTRVEGWGADIYAFGNAAIVTGYAPFGNIRPDYETNQRYEKRAREITAGIYNWQEKKAILAGLIEEYIKEVTQK
jgi:beta-galactosidase/beta-glucuronidase